MADERVPCNRCKTPMFFSENIQEEDVGPYILYTTVKIWECGWCSRMIKLIEPKLTQERIE